MVFISGDISINLADLSVRRGGLALRLEPLILDLLIFLVRNRGRLVSKHELLEQVWKGTFVGEAALTQAIAVLRKLLADNGRQQTVIETVRGRGYRFVAPLRQAASTGDFERAIDSGEPAAPLSRRPTPFVGRHRLMRELDEALEEAISGHGSMLLLHGEPGCGKTRTADELARSAHGRGVRTFTVGALAVASGHAYWPWVQLFDSIRTSGLAAQARAETRMREVLEVLRPTRGGNALSLDTASTRALEFHRLEILERVVEGLRRVAAYEPLLLVFDDVHDADIASMRILALVGKELRQMPILVLATYRDVEARTPPARAELLAELARLVGSRDEPLRGLSKADAGRLFVALTGRTVGDTMLESLYQRTAGNPFFLHQLARLELGAEDGKDDSHPHGTTALPTGVIDSIMRHLGNLSESCRSTLTAAAIFGLETRATSLARVQQRSAGEILRDLDEAMTAGVLVEDGEVHRFVHALISEALQGALDPAERARLHLRVAEVLADSGVASDAEIAQHFHAARAVGGAAGCVRYARLGAERAMRSFASDEAAELYEQALDALAHLEASDQVRLELLLGLGMARARAGDLDTARPVLRRAMEIARQRGDAESFAWAVFGYWLRSEVDQGSPELISDLEESICGYTQDTPLRARLLAQLAQALWFVPPGTRARQLATEAVDLARRVGDPDGLSFALTRAHRICQGPATEMGRRFEHSEELRRLRPRVKDPGLRLEGRWHAVWDAIAKNDRVTFDLEVADLCSDAERVGQPFAMWHAHVFRACRAFAGGRLSEVERERDAALAIAPNGMTEFARNAYHLQTLALFLLRGEFAQLIEFVRPIAVGRTLRGWKLEELRAAALLGQVEEAGRIISDTVTPRFPDGSGLERNVGWLSSLCVLAETCATLGAERQGQIVYRELLPFAGYRDAVGAGFVPRDAVSRLLGSLAALIGETTAADQHFEDALVADETFGFATGLAMDHFEFGRALLGRNDRAAARRGSALLRKAHAMATEIGMEWVARQCTRLLARERGD